MSAFAVGQPQVTTLKPLDLKWIDLDANGLPLNPVWAKACAEGRAPDPRTECDWKQHDLGCTTQQPEVNGRKLAGRCTFAFAYGNSNCFACQKEEHSPAPGAHFNWMPATYQGASYFSSYAHVGLLALADKANDKDVNFDLMTPGDAGTTAGSPRESGRALLHAEFYSRETLISPPQPHRRTLLVGSKWWRKFASLKTSDSTRKSMITRRAGEDAYSASVTGLLGLDCEHGCQSELHPVFLMAILTDQRDGDTEGWAFLARNWGDEGYCSNKVYYLSAADANTYWIAIPWKPGSSAVELLTSGSEAWSNDSRTRIEQVIVEQGRAVRLMIRLPPPTEFGRVDGMLILRWTRDDAAAADRPPIPRADCGTWVGDEGSIAMRVTPAQRRDRDRSRYLAPNTHPVVIPKPTGRLWF